MKDTRETDVGKNSILVNLRRALYAWIVYHPMYKLFCNGLLKSEDRIWWIVFHCLRSSYWTRLPLLKIEKQMPYNDSW